MYPRRQKAVCVCTAALALFPAFGPPQDRPTYNADADAVNILATVRDRNGHIVSNLTKDDFTLEEDGKRQEILYFSRQTDLPLTVGLLVDTSKSQNRLIDTERYASYQFLERLLRPGQDMAFVVHFDTEVELLQDLTNSRPLLEAALKKLETASPKSPTAGAPVPWPKPPRPTGQPPWPPVPRPPWPPVPRPPWPPVPQPPWPPGSDRLPGIGTRFYDAVFFAAHEVLPDQAGRKAVIVITDGIDMRGRRSESSAVEAALRADTIVYGIRFYDPDAYSANAGRRVGRSVVSRSKRMLNAISTETGGRMFEISMGLPLARIFDQIQEELRNQYNIGYVPSKRSPDGYRRIQLTTEDRKLTVQARQGYYAKAS